MKKHFIILFIVTLAFSCQHKSEVLEHEKYEGPSVAMKNINVLVTDSTLVKLRLVAAIQNELNNGDREFPEGIYLEFFTKDGRISSTLKARTGYYFKKEDYYKAEGNVIMNSVEAGDNLTTEILYWVPKDERIHSDQFVTITTGDEVLTGEGLEADQSFTEYTILKPSGTMTLVKGKKTVTEEKKDTVIVDDDFDSDLVFEEDTIFYEESEIQLEEQ
ncbi:LPS export ABC transporter periplasmic protein LptC [Reichenbachiella versicolor]|uniref:LPS export ABC transporter periplasmic protein LptC n=1 Tax=Reichenbachiella versicolor TaxID=1821036 RepID=UPI0013A5AB29|nr:LPS export ABC transporter periplasmic protein LptC [Reichenbachiella versicolor]